MLCGSIVVMMGVIPMIRTIEELLELDSFIERFNYLKFDGSVGAMTFGFDRYLNQKLYGSLEWKQIRDEVMIRDDGCDLGVEGYPIIGKLVIHHMNPISIKEVESKSLKVLDPRFLITTSIRTHQAIHYGNKDLLPKPFKERFSGDTRLW